MQALELLHENCFGRTEKLITIYDLENQEFTLSRWAAYVEDLPYSQNFEVNIVTLTFEINNCLWVYFDKHDLGNYM